MTKHTHGTRKSKRGAESFSRRPPASGHRHGGHGRHNARENTFETREGPLPEEEEVRLFLSRYMAALASKNLVDLFLRYAQGHALDLDAELTDAALPAVIHEAMDSEAKTIRLDVRSWRWLDQEIHQILAVYREELGGERAAGDGIEAARTDRDERISP